jgi:predicted permease
MASTLEALVPIFAWFALGLVLRLSGVASREHAGFLFRVVFFVTLPALAFMTIAVTELTAASALLPLAGFLVNLVCATLALVYTRLAGLERQLAGTVIVGACISNTGFVFPFVLGLLGPDALAQAMLYDIGNAIFVAGVAYTMATRFGQSAASPVLPSLLRVLRSPLLLCIFAAILASLKRLEIPPLLDKTLTPLGAATIPLILIALGVSMSTAKLRDGVVYNTVLLRMAGGLVAGLTLVVAFGLGLELAVIVIALATAPIGFNLVTFATIAKLDVQHATAALSISIVIGIFTLTAILLAGAHWLAMAS